MRSPGVNATADQQGYEVFESAQRAGRQEAPRAGLPAAAAPLGVASTTDHNQRPPGAAECRTLYQESILV